MKTIFPIFIFFIALVSCGGKTVALIKKESPNGKVKITIEAKRVSSIESWKVDLKVKAFNFKEGKLEFEIYAEDLNDDSVTFDWKDEGHCIIIFKQQDNTERKFELLASSEQLQLAEM
ncbi:MAG: hypothetical protein ACKVQB_01705 [Bacteroidia bacterium]